MSETEQVSPGVKILYRFLGMMNCCGFYPHNDPEKKFGSSEELGPDAMHSVYQWENGRVLMTIELSKNQIFKVIMKFGRDGENDEQLYNIFLHYFRLSGLPRFHYGLIFLQLGEAGLQTKGGEDLVKVAQNISLLIKVWDEVCSVLYPVRTSNLKIDKMVDHVKRVIKLSSIHYSVNIDELIENMK